MAPPRWARYAQISREQYEQLVREGQRRMAELSARAEQERFELFGPERPDAEVSYVELPLSGQLLGWRADGFVLSTDDEWCPWVGPAGGTEGMYLEEWSLDRGEVYPDDVVTARFEDDTSVGVVRLGCLWAVEYAGPQRALLVSTNDTVAEIKPRRPNYLGQ